MTISITFTDRKNQLKSVEHVNSKRVSSIKAPSHGPHGFKVLRRCMYLFSLYSNSLAEQFSIYSKIHILNVLLKSSCSVSPCSSKWTPKQYSSLFISIMFPLMIS